MVADCPPHLVVQGTLLLHFVSPSFSGSQNAIQPVDGENLQLAKDTFISISVAPVKASHLIAFECSGECSFEPRNLRLSSDYNPRKAWILVKNLAVSAIHPWCRRDKPNLHCRNYILNQSSEVTIIIN